MMDIDSSAWMGAGRSAWSVAVVTTVFHYDVGSYSYLLTVVTISQRERIEQQPEEGTRRRNLSVIL
jgi:hypothetical protein